MSRVQPEAQWPPRSPHEALLSTPGGRDRLKRLAERGSPSPSPSKRPNSTSSFRNRAKQLMKADMDLEDVDDEDEETLQLQLQEIQARLKLKKLQKKSKQSSDTEDATGRNGGASVGRSNSVAPSRGASRMGELRQEKLGRSKSQAEIHVPVSPVRRSQPVVEQRSPGRVLLGIDKGLKASEVSLKRAPSLKKREESSFRERLTGPFLQRANSQTGSRSGTPSLNLHDADRPQSFSERMAAMRAQDAEKEERELRIKKIRSTGFDIDRAQMEDFKREAVELPEAPRPAPKFSREEVLNSFNQPSGNLPRSKTVPNLRSAMRTTSTSTVDTAPSDRCGSQSSTRPSKGGDHAKSKIQPSEVPESEATQFDPYSTAHLSKRIIPHHVLTRQLSGKKTFLLPDLLRTVKSPDFALPDIEEDIVVFGIIAMKSDPRAHVSGAKTQSQGKYIIMGLTDLKWEVDLFLFGSAFDKFWKMTPGTVIAILNPGIMGPKRADTGKWSFTLNSDADTILEVGTARDLGFCKSVRKDGTLCPTWIDKRHTEFCDYHVNEALKKTRAGRMEVNSMNFGKGDFGKGDFGKGDSGRRKYNSQNYGEKHLERMQQLEEDKKYGTYDKETQSRVFIGKRTTANLLDDVDFDPDAFHRGSTKAERVTKKLLAQEKERELAKKLGKLGGGLGADYMRTKNPTQPEVHISSGQDAPPPPDAAALGLLSGKAKDIALSPIKRKRTNTSLNSTAMGWGSDLTKKLGSMKNGESLQPVKKKTRFVTEKGIREAGRESLGGEAVKVQSGVMIDDDDDDDDLDIIRD